MTTYDAAKGECVDWFTVNSRGDAFELDAVAGRDYRITCEDTGGRLKYSHSSGAL